jgi:hypothetical protein
LVVIGILSSNSSTSPQQNIVAYTPAEPPTEATETPAFAAIPPVRTASTRLAARHLSLALDNEGFAGAMTYSQNCFRSLEATFSWTKLDQCAAFDALATLALSQADESQAESSYFNTTASAERFTQWAAKERADPQVAQAHLEDLDQAALVNIPLLQQGPSDEVDAAAVAGSGATVNNDAVATSTELRDDPALNNLPVNDD